MAIGTAALIGAGVSAASGIVGAGIQSGAANKAADAQTQAQREALEFQKEQQRIALEQLAPFRDAGINATNQLAGLSQAGNPMEVAQRNQAQEQVQRQLAAQGLLRSTAQGDQLSNIEVGLAGQRAQMLQALAGQGASAAGGSVNAIANFGGQIGQGMQNIGAIQGQNALAQGQALGGAFTGIGNVVQNTLNTQAQQQRADELMKLLSGRTHGGGTPLSAARSLYQPGNNVGFGGFGGGF